MSYRYEHRGASYIDLLKRMHSFLAPETYLEIGTLNGSTLALSKCATICVDPSFQIKVDPTGSRPATMLFQTTSDRFFERHDPKKLLGAPLELAFLDGLHEAETLLRDFANVERSCKRNSIVCMHDCIPIDEAMTCRENNGGLWTGDVWKVVPILKKYRPDLMIHTFDAGPTGLVCCTNLNPDDTRLLTNWKDIWSEWGPTELADFDLRNLVSMAEMIWTENVNTPEKMRKYFWL